MGTYILRRLLWTIPVILVTTILTFTLVKQLPYQPFENNQKLSKSAIANLKRIYGLDQSLPRQYLNYLNDLASAPPDLGRSIRPGMTPVRNIIFGDAVFAPEAPLMERARSIWNGPLGTSMKLGAMAFVLALFVGTGFGIVSALKVNTWIDAVVLLVSTLAFAIPSFVVARYWVQYLPFDWNIGWERIGPISVLALGILPYFTRLVRASMLETLQADFVMAARSKGLPWRRTVLQHVLRNSLIPMVTNAGPLFGFVLTGSFIIETIMNVPGIAYYFVNAFRDMPDPHLILNLTVLLALLIVMVNLAVDIIVAWLDPRISHE